MHERVQRQSGSRDCMVAPLAWMPTRKDHGDRYAPATPELAVAL